MIVDTCENIVELHMWEYHEITHVRLSILLVEETSIKHSIL